jgi:hypothetical protein
LPAGELESQGWAEVESVLAIEAHALSHPPENGLKGLPFEEKRALLRALDVRIVVCPDKIVMTGRLPMGRIPALAQLERPQETVLGLKAVLLGLERGLVR